MWELSKSFQFEAAHRLSGTSLGVVSEEIHGHSFRAEIAVRGTPDRDRGMIVDLGALEQQIALVRATLDHKYLNDVEALGTPTLENLARFIFDRVRNCGSVSRVTVFRDSRGEACTYFGDTAPRD